jgi:hypothetical protein
VEKHTTTASKEEHLQRQKKYDPATKGVTILDKSLPSDSNDPARLNNVSVNNLPKNEPTRGVIDAIINYILIPLGQGASAIKH